MRENARVTLSQLDQGYSFWTGGNGDNKSSTTSPYRASLRISSFRWYHCFSGVVCWWLATLLQCFTVGSFISVSNWFLNWLSFSRVQLCKASLNVGTLLVEKSLLRAKWDRIWPMQTRPYLASSSLDKLVTLQQRPKYIMGTLDFSLVFKKTRLAFLPDTQIQIGQMIQKTGSQSRDMFSSWVITSSLRILGNNKSEGLTTVQVI